MRVLFGKVDPRVKVSELSAGDGFVFDGIFNVRIKSPGLAGFWGLNPETGGLNISTSKDPDGDRLVTACPEAEVSTGIED